MLILLSFSYLGIHIVRVYRLYAVFLDIELFVCFFSSCCTTRHICDDDAVISKRNCFKYLFAFFFDRHHTHSNANKNKLKGIDDEYKTIEIMAPVI